MLLFVCNEAVESKLVKLETSHTVILPPTLSDLCHCLYNTPRYPLHTTNIKAQYSTFLIRSSLEERVTEKIGRFCQLFLVSQMHQLFAQRQTDLWSIFYLNAIQLKFMTCLTGNLQFCGLIMAKMSTIPIYLFTKVSFQFQGYGCGSVDRAITSHVRGPRFESSQRFNFKQNMVYC